MIRDGRELFQQPSVVRREAAAPLDQIRPIPNRPVQALRTPPSFDACMVAAAEHLGGLPAAEVGRPRELGLLEQAVLTEALGDRAVRVAHRTVEEPGHRFDANTHAFPHNLK